MTSSRVVRAVPMVALLAALVPAAPTAAVDDEWFAGSSMLGVRIKVSRPGGADEAHMFANFKRTGGKTARQVRIAERHYRPKVGKASPRRYSSPVSLDVGERVIIGTQGKLPCRPKRRRMLIEAYVRAQRADGTWGPWEYSQGVWESNRKC